jgi:hypothetical protein
MSASSAPQLAQLLSMLRNARDPWSRLKLVAQGARALGRLTPAQRADLLRTLGLEGAEELAELAAGGDPQTAETLAGALRALESDPRRVEQIGREIADPRTRRATLTGLAAHVMEAVTAPATAAAAAVAARPKQGSTVAAATGAAGGAAATAQRATAQRAAAARTAPPAGGKAATAPPAPPRPARRPVPADIVTPPALPAAAGPPPAPPPPAVTTAPAPAPGQPPRAAPGPEAAGTAPRAVPPGRRPPAPRAAPPPAALASPSPQALPSSAPPAGALAHLRALRRTLDSGTGVSSAALAELVEDGLTSDWARRRALAAAFAGGAPADLDEALRLVARLASPAARRWALGDLAAGRAWSEEEWQRLIAAADTPAARRRLERRRAPATPVAARVG